GLGGEIERALALDGEGRGGPTAQRDGERAGLARQRLGGGEPRGDVALGETMAGIVARGGNTPHPTLPRKGGGDSWKAMVFPLPLDGGGSGWGCLGAPEREGGDDDHQPLTFWRFFAASYAARAAATSGRAEISGTATSHQ